MSALTDASIEHADQARDLARSSVTAAVAGQATMGMLVNLAAAQTMLLANITELLAAGDAQVQTR